jgi:hypothetical protein
MDELEIKEQIDQAIHDENYELAHELGKKLKSYFNTGLITYGKD